MVVNSKEKTLESVVYIAGMKMLCGGYTQYTPTGASYFQKAGRWQKIPEVGAIQYNYIASIGRIGHVAIVKECYVDYKKETFTVKTIEGNTNSVSWERNGGMVAEKSYLNVPFSSVGIGTNNHIQGYGIPLFDSDTCGVSDFIKIAEREIGYIEKDTNKLLGDVNSSATEEEKVQNKGINNYTKYGSWYGQNGVAWCQQFVSWCAYMACLFHNSYKYDGWKLLNDKWYYLKNGVPLKGIWSYIDNRWYVFDSSGKMITGWFKENDDDWYYLAEDGGMCSNQWIKWINGDHIDWHYLTSSGLMAKDCYIYRSEPERYYYIDKNGLWDGKYIEADDPNFRKEFNSIMEVV